MTDTTVSVDAIMEQAQVFASAWSLVPVEASVHQEHSGYTTNTIRGIRASCTYSDKVAIERLAERLFPKQHTTIVPIPCVAVGKLHSKWRIAPEVK